MSDITITASLVTFQEGIKLTGVAGNSFTAGQTVYLDSSVNPPLLKKAFASGTAAEADAVGIALHTSAVGQPLTYAGNGSRLVIGGTTSKATTYMISANSGGIAPQADLVSTNKITRLGYALDTAGNFVIDIKNTGVVV